MATKIRGATVLTGGGAGAVDAISGAVLADGDIVIAVYDGQVYTYVVDADSGLAESSPHIIAPDVSAGDKRLILQSMSDEIDVLAIYGDGVNRTRTAIEAAKTALGVVNKYTFLIRRGTWTIDDDLTVTSNLTLKVVPGALLQIASGKILTINGPFEAGLYQVFSGAGTATFGSGSVKEVYPEWWATNTTPGTTDMTAAIQAAMDSAFSIGAPVRLLPTKYLVSSSLSIPKGSLTWRQATILGSGGSDETAYVSAPESVYGTTIKTSAAFADTLFDVTGSRYPVIKDMLLLSGKTAGSIAIHMNASNMNYTFENVKFYGWETCLKIGTEGGTYANDDQGHLDRVVFANATYAIRVENHEAMNITAIRTSFKSTVEFAYYASFLTAAGLSAGSFQAFGCQFMASDTNIYLGNAGRWAVDINASHFEGGTGKILDANVSADATLGSVKISGSSINFGSGGGETLAPMIRVLGGLNLVFEGNKIAALKPLIYLSGNNLSATFLGNQWSNEPAYQATATDHSFPKITEINELHTAHYHNNTVAMGHWMPLKQNRVSGKLFTYGDYVSDGTHATYMAGSVIMDSTPGSGLGNIVQTVTGGTAGTLNSGNTTGGINSGENELTVSVNTDLFVGSYITIAGVTGVKRVINIRGTSVSLDSNSDATVAGAAVAFSAAVNTTLYSVTGAPAAGNVVKWNVGGYAEWVAP